MFHEPVYFLYYCITAMFGETESSLLRYSDVHERLVG